MNGRSDSTPERAGKCEMTGTYTRQGLEMTSGWDSGEVEQGGRWV